MKQNKLSQPHRPTKRQTIGAYGEDLAAAFLRRNGLRIIDRNFKARYGEIDIISLDRDTVVFVEVKTRIDATYGVPEEAITSWKLRELIKTAQYYVLLHPELPEALRIDVVAIELHQDRSVHHIRHISNVTS